MSGVKIGVVALVLSAAAIAVAQDADREAKLVAYLEACDSAREEEIPRIKDAIKKDKLALAKLKRERLSARLTKDAKAEKVAALQARISATEERLELAEAGELIFAPFAYGQMASGAMGTLRDPRFYVDDVVDGQNVIGRLHWYPIAGRLPVQTKVWLRGFDTKDVVDGGLLQIEQPFSIVGTTQYETVIGGTETVFQFEPMDIAELEKLAAARK